MYNKDELLCFNILESVNNILDFTKQFSNIEELVNDRLHFDATMMNFIIIGEMES